MDSHAGVSNRFSTLSFACNVVVEEVGRYERDPWGVVKPSAGLALSASSAHETVANPLAEVRAVMVGVMMWGRQGGVKSKK